MSALHSLASVNGSDGWLSTGASTMSSTIIAEGEPSGETHADHADARAAAALVLRGGELAQPHRDGAGPLERQAENSCEMQAGPIDPST